MIKSVQLLNTHTQKSHTLSHTQVSSKMISGETLELKSRKCVTHNRRHYVSGVHVFKKKKNQVRNISFVGRS